MLLETVSGYKKIIGLQKDPQIFLSSRWNILTENTDGKNLLRITLNVSLVLEKLIKDSTSPTSWRLFPSLL